MGKKIITIIIDDDNKSMSVDIIKEKETNVGKYIVPTSNFSGYGKDILDDSYVIGIPCKILTEPYQKRKKNILGHYEGIDKDVIDVMSMVTGMTYTIPTEWGNIFDTLEEANNLARIKGTYNPSTKNLIGKKYWPYSNSFNKDMVTGARYNLVDKECRIVSEPFREKTGDKDSHFKNVECDFILVYYEGMVYRVQFGEWGLQERSKFRFYCLTKK